MQPPPIVRGAQGMKTRLLVTVPAVLQQPQRAIEKELFHLRHRNAVFLVLPGITFVPVETGELRQVDHIMYIMKIYDGAQHSDI